MKHGNEASLLALVFTIYDMMSYFSPWQFSVNDLMRTKCKGNLAMRLFACVSIDNS